MARTLVVNGFPNGIHHCDCVAAMKSVNAGAVDLAFADPPFNIGYEYDVYDDTRDRGHYLQWSREWISEVFRVLKPTGAFWLAIGDEYAAELKLLAQEIGFRCRSWVIWYYTFGVNCTKKFSRSHAHLFYFVKDERNFTFHSAALVNRVPSARQLVYNDIRANPRGRLPDDTWILRPQDLVDCFTPDEDTWYFPRVAGTFKERAGFHGCQMPEQLLGRIIRLCSNEEEVVLDPFAGSATTLVVAKKLGRSFLGFDLSPEYVERGIQRLEQARRGDPLEGAPEPSVSAPATPVGKTRRPSSARRKGKPVIFNSAAANLSADVLNGTDALFKKGLVEAFRGTHEGYSPDRVVTDPELNRRFVELCRALGLPGDARSWNWKLFDYRKDGDLAGLTARRTTISWQGCDQYLFASEIALAQMLADDCESLDEILCDPDLASRFDKIAQNYAPGFEPFQYRWAALKLRKEAYSARVRARVLAPVRLGKAVSVTDSDWSGLADRAGVYLVSGNPDTEKLYVGEALDLRDRLQTQFRPELLNVWLDHTQAENLFIRTFTVERRPPELLAYQSLLVGKHHPRLNFKELAA